MDALENLFDDIRKWNRKWKVFEYEKFQNNNIVKMPPTSDDFIKILSSKYDVTFKIQQ